MLFNQGLSVAGFTTLTPLIASQKGVEKSQNMQSKWVDRIIRLVHRNIRSTHSHGNSAKDLKIVLPEGCRIIRLFTIGLSDGPVFDQGSADSAKDWRELLPEACRIIRWSLIGLSDATPASQDLTKDLWSFVPEGCRIIRCFCIGLSDPSDNPTHLYRIIRWFSTATATFLGGV